MKLVKVAIFLAVPELVHLWWWLVKYQYRLSHELPYPMGEDGSYAWAYFIYQIMSGYPPGELDHWDKKIPSDMKFPPLFKIFPVPPKRSSVIIYVGQWACRISWDRHGVFSNGSRWWSGWGRWKEDWLT